MAQNTDRKTNKRVLCAFRSKQIAQEVTRRVEALGYDASTSNSAEDLISAVAQEGPSLLLLDGALGPAGDGGALAPLVELRKSKVSGSDLPAVLFLRDEPSEPMSRRIGWLGALPFWGGKLTKKALRSLIDRALDASRDAFGEGKILSLCERLRSKDSLVALGLTESARRGEIDRAYERLRRLLDPDALGRASNELRAVVRTAIGDLNRAYDELCDPDETDTISHLPDLEAEIRAGQQEDTDREAAKVYREGEKQMEAQDWTAALRSFERAAELRPKMGEYHACVGWAMYLVYGPEAENVRAAIGHAKTGMLLAPEHFHPPLVLGQLYQCTNRLDLALKAFKRAVHLNPQSIEAVRELRIMQMREKKEGDGGLFKKLLRR